MNPLSRVAGRAVDRALGLPPTAAPYVVRRDVPVTMPDGVVLLGDHYRPAGHDRPLPVVVIRSPYDRGGASFLFARRWRARASRCSSRARAGRSAPAAFRPF
jgi:predicted acyl esterase